MIRTDEQHVIALRLTRQGLLGSSKTTPVEATASVVGVQAQVMAAARMSLWARAPAITEDAVDNALWNDRELVRTWCMRGTVHLILAHDLPVILSAIRYGVTHRVRVWLQKKLPGVDLDCMIRYIVDVLGEEPQTRRELAESLARRHGGGGEEVSDPWGGVVRYAALQGLVCFGPPRNQEITYVRTDKWLHDEYVQHMRNGPLGREEPAPDLGILLQKYLHAFGPATVQDFAYWSGLTAREAHSAAQVLGSRLVEVEWGGRRGLICEEDVPALQTPLEVDLTEPILLPQFDVHLLAHRDKSQIVSHSSYKEVFRKAGWVSAVVLQRGRVIGVWSHRWAGRKLVFTIEMLTEATDETREAIAIRCESLARLLGCSTADVRFEGISAPDPAQL